MTKNVLLRWLTVTILYFSPSVFADVPADAVWIDVRTPAEYASGHLEQATSIPFDGIGSGIAKLKLSKDTPIYLYCAVGGRAELAKKQLETLNYTSVINVGSLEAAETLSNASQD